MKASAIYLAAIAQVASAHYFFDTNIVNGVAQPQFKYVRQSTRQTKYNPIKFSSNPPADIRDGSFIDGPDIVCNQGAFSSAGKTEVLTVAAGEEVRLKVAVGAKMGHPGPEFVYMAAAPNGVKGFSGIDADWFKIHEQGVCDGGDFTSTAWCDYNNDYIAAKIPIDTPPMEYLMRFEHIGVHRSHVNQPEHYVGCIQVKVTGSGKGVPGPTVKFPGAYKATDPYANFSIYGGRKAFPMPGPAVWKGGAGKQDTTPAVSSAAPVASPSKAPVSAAPSKAPVSAAPSKAPTSAPAAARPSTLATVVKPKPTGGCGAQRKRRSH